MRRATKLALVGGATGVATLFLSGYPKRMGLTKSEASVSMPGDLILPTASLQADRLGYLAATPEQIWPLVEELAEQFADLWGLPVYVAYKEEPSLLVVHTKGDKLWEATLAIQLGVDSDGRTTARIRERYLAEDRKGSAAAHAAVSITAPLVKKWLLEAKRLLATTGR